MLNKITRGNESEQVKAFVAEAKRMVDAYGWQDRVTYPYSFSVPVLDTIDELAHFDEYTKSSQDLLVCMANGFAKNLNSWAEWAEDAYKRKGKKGVIIYADGKAITGKIPRDNAEYLVKLIKDNNYDKDIEIREA